MSRQAQLPHAFWRSTQLLGVLHKHENQDSVCVSVKISFSSESQIFWFVKHHSSRKVPLVYQLLTFSQFFSVPQGLKVEYV